MQRIFIRLARLVAGGALLVAMIAMGGAFASLQAHADEAVAQDAASAQTVSGTWSKTPAGWKYLTGDSCAYGFVKVGGKTYYLDSKTGIMKTGWIKPGGDWYLLGGSGAMRTGWARVGGIWYYLDPADGRMLTGKRRIGNATYSFASSGAMRTGWSKEGADWCYYGSSGAMRTGWLKSGPWYYLDPDDGKMKTGRYRVGNAWYISSSSGAMYANRWVKLSEGWYFATSSGALESGWLRTGGKWYWLQPDKGNLMIANARATVSGALYSFDSSGAMHADRQIRLDNGACGYAASSGAITAIGVFDGNEVILKDAKGRLLTGWQKLAGKWFYGDSKGVMQTGWVKVGGKWYWLASDGVMAANAWVDGGRYYVGGDGAWIQANIIQDIRGQFAHGTKTARYQKYIVLHDTEGGGTAQNVVSSWASNGNRVASHFVIGKDGTIVQCVPLDQIAHHVGFAPRGSNARFGVPEDGRDDRIGTTSIGSYSPDYGMNSYSIGIELVHQGSTGEGYPKAQLEALDKVIAYIDSYYGFKSTIIDHKMWNGNSDTSKEFSWYLANYRDHRTHD